MLSTGHIQIRECKHKMHKVPAECLSNNFINTDSLLSQQRAMPAAGTGIRTNLAEESIPRQSLDPLPTCQKDSTTSVQDHRDPLGWSSHNQIYLPGSATAELKLGDGHSSARGPCKVVGKLVNVPQTKANSAPAGASRKNHADLRDSPIETSMFDLSHRIVVCCNSWQTSQVGKPEMSDHWFPHRKLPMPRCITKPSFTTQICCLRCPQRAKIAGHADGIKSTLKKNPWSCQELSCETVRK